MWLPKNKAILPNARKLRKEMTRHEKRLWYDFLRTMQPCFRRQEIIGTYTADFYCSKAKLVVELDSSQHYEPETQENDAVRTAYFNALGIRVLRFPNIEIDRNFEGVCLTIARALSCPPSTLPFHQPMTKRYLW